MLINCSNNIFFWFIYSSALQVPICSNNEWSMINRNLLYWNHHGWLIHVRFPQFPEISSKGWMGVVEHRLFFSGDMQTLKYCLWILDPSGRFSNEKKVPVWAPPDLTYVLMLRIPGIAGVAIHCHTSYIQTTCSAIGSKHWSISHIQPNIQLSTLWHRQNVHDIQMLETLAQFFFLVPELDSRSLLRGSFGPQFAGQLVFVVPPPSYVLLVYTSH